MDKKTSFLNNNSTLVFSWFFVLLCGKTYEVFFPSYSIYIEYCYYFSIAFVIVSIFYSFYQSIRNININKTYAFTLLILYLVFWIFLPYGLIDDSMDGINNIDNIDKGDIIRLSIFIFINICILLFHKFKKESRIMIPYLLFYSFNFLLILIFLLAATSS